MSEWKRVKLGEIADCSLGKMLDHRKNHGTPRPYLANYNVRWGVFDLAEVLSMPFEDAEIERYSVKPGDLLVCEGGEIGRCALWKDSETQMMFQKALHRVRVDNAKCIPEYAFYWFLNAGKSNFFRQFSSGATILHLPREKLLKIELALPPLATQRRIAAILSDYDAAIANCRKQIALLEEAAMRLYREWAKKDMGKKVLLVDVVEVVYGFPFEGKLFNSKGDGLPIVRIRNVPEGESNDYTVETAPDRYVVRDGDLLIGMDGEFYVNFWSGGDAYLVQRTCRLRPNEDRLTGYIREAIRKPIEEFQAAIVGSTVGHLGKRDIDTITITLPTDCEFVKLLQKGFVQQLNYRKQIRSLTEARDRLLPKLMSGEVTV